jgi:hypothetical protein
MKYFLIFILTILLFSCTDEVSAKKALKDAGYKPPYTFTGYGFMDCSEDDVMATRFRAMSPDSTRKVSGCVCQGLFKGKTIRLD